MYFKKFPCRKYLQHVQKSVFEGYITEAKLKKLKAELHKVCKTEEDSIIIYRFDSLKYSQREILGIYEQKHRCTRGTNKIK